jgi:hypothetical protein
VKEKLVVGPAITGPTPTRVVIPHPVTSYPPTDEEEWTRAMLERDEQQRRDLRLREERGKWRGRR